MSRALSSEMANLRYSRRPFSIDCSRNSCPRVAITPGQRAANRRVRGEPVDGISPLSSVASHFLCGILFFEVVTCDAFSFWTQCTEPYTGGNNHKLRPYCRVYGGSQARIREIPPHRKLLALDSSLMHSLRPMGTVSLMRALTYRLALKPIADQLPILQPQDLGWPSGISSLVQAVFAHTREIMGCPGLFRQLKYQ